MSEYHAIFFDLDGTLRVSMPERFEAFVDYAGRAGIMLTPDQVKCCEREAHRYWASRQVDADMARFDTRGFWVNHNMQLLDGIGVKHERAAENIQDLFDGYAPEDRLFDDTRHVLETLDKAGYTLALVSNRDSDLAPIAAGYGIDGFFDFVLWAGQLKSYKPDPKIFYKSLELAGLSDPAHALYVGDNYFADIVGARGVGMDALLIDPRDVFADYYDKRVKRLRDVLKHVRH